MLQDSVYPNNRYISLDEFLRRALNGDAWTLEDEPVHVDVKEEIFKKIIFWLENS